MSTFDLNPFDTNYLRSDILFRQLTEKPRPMVLAATDVVQTTPPNVHLDGSGRAYLLGKITIDSESVAPGMEVATLPKQIVPLVDMHHSIVVLRAGAYVANAIKITSNGADIESVVVDSAGVYLTMPSLLLLGPGSGASISPVAKAVSWVVSAIGSGYAPGDTFTATGGTASAQFVATIATTRIATFATDDPGTGYVPGDTITVAGGTFTTAGILTVTNTQVVSATVFAGGSGGSDGTQTVTGTTGTGTKFEASVTVAGGAITDVLSITVAGNYTVNPTDIQDEPVTGASLTGASLTVVMGVLTATITNRGVYSVNTSSFTQGSTSGTGTGATFDTVLFGINAGTITTPGSYTALPSNPVAQGSSSGSGTSATLTTSWGILSVTVADGGTGFTEDSELITTGGGGSGAEFTLNLGEDTAGKVTLINEPTDEDILIVDGVNFLVKSYDA